jgi:hypothetical protein
MRAQKAAFSWAKTVKLSETSNFTYNINGVPTALPPVVYTQIYVRDADQLRELEEMGIHWALVRSESANCVSISCAMLANR